MDAAEAGMVIIGTGEAGASAAVARRENGWEGAIHLFGEEPHAPYERPPLSKAVMVAASGAVLPTIGHATRLDAMHIVHRPNAVVVHIDPAERRVRLTDGDSFPYARLLLATGARPRRLGVPGGEAALYLRTFADAIALREQLGPNRHVAMIGGGFIGLELAASARERGSDVTVIESAPRILMRGVPTEIAALIEARHRAAGVVIMTGTGVARIERDSEMKVVILADGSRIAADSIIAGIGAVPETALGEAAGLTIENGIAVDANLRTSDPDIFAAGDCCSFPHPLYDGRRIRLEAWRNARDQGGAAALNMLGLGKEYSAVPWFWSDQYNVHLQIVGLADGAERTIARDIGDDARMMFHLASDGRLLSASGAGPIGKIARDIRLAEMLVARRAKPDLASLASPSLTLRSFLSRTPRP